MCSQCHPFYTGKQKILDTGGRVARFEARYAKKTAQDAKDKAAETVTLTRGELWMLRLAALGGVTSILAHAGQLIGGLF